MELINFYASTVENCQYTCILTHFPTAICRTHTLTHQTYFFPHTAYSINGTSTASRFFFCSSHLICACGQIEYFQIARSILMKGK